MNAVEIEQAVTRLAEQPYEAAEFPYVFLQAFGVKDVTLKRLRSGNSNTSDVPHGVLLRNSIHIATCADGDVDDTLRALRDSPATTKAKAGFVLATDGRQIQAEELTSGETRVCAYDELPDHFGFLLPLAGISTVREIKDNPIDVRATSRLTRLYVELLRANPDWATEQRRSDMNHFMARLIFCFFAEDTGILAGGGQFIETVMTMSDRDGSNTHDVLAEIFRAMNLKYEDRTITTPPLARWAAVFPYVNGGLFSGSTEAPRFSRSTRSYLQHAGGLNWKEINPDIFGSMIQAVADDEERGAIGMHYTSVPNILKVLNPLFLDELRAALDEAGTNERKLLNLRKRMARIRVFDPACGSGNFLVIAYKQMRGIEAEINQRRGEQNHRSSIPLTNFRGIEIRDFPAEIARLALIIAEFQCDVLYRGQQDAVANFLPLQKENWIVRGNALRLDWATVCPAQGSAVRLVSDDLFGTPLQQTEIGFEHEQGEVFICGNPPYSGLSSQSIEQKQDLQGLFCFITDYWKSFDYVMGWFWKSKLMIDAYSCRVGLVSTNSICQGQLVPMFWPLIINNGVKIEFAHESFKWSNLASKNAGVSVVVIGIGNSNKNDSVLMGVDKDGVVIKTRVQNINAYLIGGPNIFVDALPGSRSGIPTMYWGNKPVDGGFLIMSIDEARKLIIENFGIDRFLRPYYGSQEYIDGLHRVCIWVSDSDLQEASKFEILAKKFDAVEKFRSNSKAKETRLAGSFSHRFRQIQGVPGGAVIIVPIHTGEMREFLPVGLLSGGAIISNAAFGIYDSPIWCLSLIASRLHLAWIATVCGKLGTSYRYSNTLGWNTFPVPVLTEQNKADLTRCAEDILLAREAHFPATIADLYDPDAMPDDLRRAHERNDETLERIYIGRRFRNDTERLEKLFDLYTKMTAAAPAKPKKATRAGPADGAGPAPTTAPRRGRPRRITPSTP